MGRERERHKVPYGAVLTVKADQPSGRHHPGQLGSADPPHHHRVRRYTSSSRTSKEGRPWPNRWTMSPACPPGGDRPQAPWLRQGGAPAGQADRRQRPGGEDPGTDHSVAIGFQVGALIQVRDGQDVGPRRGAGAHSGRRPEDARHHRRSAARGRAVRGPQPKDKGTLAEMTGTISFGKETKGARCACRSPTRRQGLGRADPQGEERAGARGQVVNKGEHIVDGPADPQDILRLLGIEELARYIVDEVQDVYRLQGVKINDKHIGVIVRQMLRRVVVENPGETSYIAGRAGRALARSSTPTRQAQGRQDPGHLLQRAAGHHQGLAVDRLLHLRGVVPGDDARAHRGCHHGQARRAARPEGKRHRRSPDPRRYRSGLPPGAQGQGRHG